MFSAFHALNPLQAAASGGGGLLLDTYAAAGAYSLRALSTPFNAADIITARRSVDDVESGFTAAEITDGTLASWAGAGDAYVKTWHDQSGNGNDFTQATAANQPQIVAGGSVLTGAHGKPAILFSSTRRLPMLDLVGANDEQWWHMQFEVNTLTTNFEVWDIVYIGAKWSWTGVKIGWNGTAFALASREFVFSGAINQPTATPILLTHQALAGSPFAAFWKDGSAVTAAIRANTVSDNAPVCSASQLMGGSANPKISELIVRNGALSADRTAIESDMQTYYA